MKRAEIKRWSVIGILVLLMMSACSQSRPKTNNPAVQGKLWSFKSDSQGFDTQNFFYDNGQQVIVFDTQFTEDYAKKSIAFIQSKTSSPITHVVITHPNPDKFNGIQAFQKLGAKVIASRKTVQAMPGVHAYKKYYFTKIAKSFTDKTYPTLPKVDIEFEDRYELKLKNGEILTLQELGSAGVSSNQTVAWLSSVNTWVVGDLIHYKVHAWLEGGIVNGKPVADIDQWKKTLAFWKKQVKAGQRVVGGRGESTDALRAIDEQIRYLSRAQELVGEYVKSLGDKASELKSDKAAEHHKALQEKFEKAFPEYKLGYMIGYGVYGLILRYLP